MKHVQVILHLMKQLDVLIFIAITHYYLSTPVPVFNPALTWPYEVLSYVGNSYFCDTGAHTQNSSETLYMDPLCDGEGCGGSSTCCSLNSPPWFCQHLNYHRSDDLELRLCSYGFEDKLVSLVEIYVKQMNMN